MVEVEGGIGGRRSTGAEFRACSASSPSVTATAAAAAAAAAAGC